MILIIHGTNRLASQSKPISDFVQKYLNQNYDGDVELLDLSEIPISAFDSTQMYDSGLVSEKIQSIQVSKLIPASKIVFVSPEYNGSFPGILKLFIDACSIRDSKPSFYHKKTLLIGVASGRAGNLRGMEHLTGILMYMNMIIYPNKLPISKIETLLNDRQQISDELTIRTTQKLLDEFLAF